MNICSAAHALPLPAISSSSTLSSSHEKTFSASWLTYGYEKCNELFFDGFHWHLQAVMQQKAPFETWHRLSWQKTWLYIFPSLKRAHFVSSPELVKKLLVMEREGDVLISGMKDKIEPFTGKDNMLLCPFSEHRRLRAPLEKHFSLRDLKKNCAIRIAFTALNRILKHLSDSLANNADQVFAMNVIAKEVLGLSDIENEVLANVGKTLLNEKSYEDIYFEIDDLYHDSGIRSDGAMNALECAHKAKMSSDPGIKSKGLTRSEKISSTMLLFAAGTHTTTNFLNCFLTILKRYPEYCEKIIEEWDDFVKDFRPKMDNKIELVRALSSFVVGIEGKYSGSKWLEYCFFEAQRLYPIFPDLTRVAKADFILDNQKFSKGDEIHINLRAYHRNAEIWGADPDIFKPERFDLSERKGKLLTFGAGSQGCIGKHLTRIEATLLAAELVIFFTWDHQPERKLLKENYNGFVISADEISWSCGLSIKPQFRSLLTNDV